MSLATKRDTSDRLSTGRNRSQHSFRPANKANRPNSTGIEADGSRTHRMTFAEDFMLEHNHSGLSITVIGLSGSSENVARESQLSAQCYGFPN